jgi:hypothetical protein
MHRTPPHGADTAPPAFLQAAPVPWRGYARGPAPALTVGLLLLGGALLVHHARSVDWPAMREVFASMPLDALALAGVLSAASYAVYCTFDLLGRRTTGHSISRRHTLAIAFVGHACALTLGPAGAGVRFRLYAHHGLPMHLTAALWLFNVATNWLGFGLLAGLVFATRWIALPAHWGIGARALQAVGFALLAGIAVYLAACRFGHHREVIVRGVAFRLPPFSVALLQCLLSLVNWLLLAAIIWVLLSRHAPYEDVLGALMASALALAVVDVPAGLGVLETIFVGLLGHAVRPAEVLGALLAYRAMYFVAPLAIASVVYLVLEWDAIAAARAGRRRACAPLKEGPRSPDARCPRQAPDAPRPPRRSS